MHTCMHLPDSEGGQSSFLKFIHGCSDGIKVRCIRSRSDPELSVGKAGFIIRNLGVQDNLKIKGEGEAFVQSRFMWMLSFKQREVFEAS